MVLTDFFKNILNVSGDLSQPSNVSFQSSAFAESIKGTTFVTTDVLSPSIVSGSTQTIIDNLKNSFFDLTRLNLIGLGEASIDISKALNEQITIREDQRKIDVEQANNLQLQINTLNERVSVQLTELGDSLKDIGSGGFDPIKFFTDNPLIGGIGIGGLAVAGVVLFLVLKR